MIRRKIALPCTFRVRFNSFSNGKESKVNMHRDYVGIAIFSGISLGTFFLGVWQTRRYFSKINTIEDSALAMKTPPENVSVNDNSLKSKIHGLRGKKVTLTGRFDFQNEIKLGPRAPPAGLLGSVAQGMSTNPQGYYILTPLILTSEKESKQTSIIFVNRGWVPKSFENHQCPDGVVTFTAIPVDTEKKGMFSPDNTLSPNLLWLEYSELKRRMCANYDVVPLILDMIDENECIPSSSSISFPVAKREGNITMSSYVTPETHVAYAFTWYSLTAAGLAMTYFKFKKRQPFLNKIRNK